MSASVKLKRFAVRFNNQRIFVNAADPEQALALAKTRFFKVYREAGVAPPAGMSTPETFAKAASVQESTRH
jgi:hypothetical protein